MGILLLSMQCVVMYIELMVHRHAAAKTRDIPEAQVGGTTMMTHKTGLLIKETPIANMETPIVKAFGPKPTNSDQIATK